MQSIIRYRRREKEEEKRALLVHGGICCCRLTGRGTMRVHFACLNSLSLSLTVSAPIHRDSYCCCCCCPLFFHKPKSLFRSAFCFHILFIYLFYLTQSFLIFFSVLLLLLSPTISCAATTFDFLKGY